MPVKIRLARHGKKDAPFYHVVVADSRAPRDGKFIEKIGSYNPNTNPATITLEFDRALHWLLQGAQPTDTARAILSYRGVMYKKHLLGGVAKNAFTAEQAQEKFDAWMADKASRINAKAVALKDVSRADAKKRLEEETKAKEARLKAIEAKKAAVEAVPAEEEAAQTAETAEEAVAAVADEPQAEVPAEAAVEAVAQEPTAEETAGQTTDDTGNVADAPAEAE